MTKVDLAHSLQTTLFSMVIQKEKKYTLIIPLSLQKLYYPVITLIES